MTRINLIDPSHLTKRHLIAEYKEITQFLHNVKNQILKIYRSTLHWELVM